MKARFCSRAFPRRSAAQHDEDAQPGAYLGLLGVATGGQPAAHTGYVIWNVRGRDAAGRALSDVGRRRGRLWRAATADGHDAIYLVAQENYPAEFVEASYPLRVRATRSIATRAAPDAGAAAAASCARWRSSATEATVAVRIEGDANPPWGVAGGHCAGSGRASSIRDVPTSACSRRLSDGNIVRRGDVVRIETGGGGGWGHPFDREPERVLADVRGGFVSRASAEAHYGVVLTDGWARDRSRSHGRTPRPAAGDQALPPSRLPRGARMMASCAIAQGPRHRRRRHGRHVHRHHAARPGNGPRLERQDPVHARRSFARLRQRHRRGAEASRGSRARDVARVLHGTTIATNLILEGKGAPAALITTSGFKYVLEIGRHDVPRRASLFAWVKPKRPGSAGAHLRDWRPHRPRRKRARRRSTRTPCARPRARSRARASGRSRSCCCTATPTPRTSGASPPSFARASRMRWSRSRARCCRCSANTSAA